MKRFLGRRGPGRVGVGVWLAVAALGAAMACDDGPQSHVYEASLYEQAASCMDPSTSLGLVATSSGDLDCAPTCLVLPAPPAVGAEKVYVSTMCGPYPAGYDISQTDPACPAALAAWATGGPNSCASAPSDGGMSEAGAGSDAAMSEDAASDDGSDSASDGSGIDGAMDGSAPLDAPAG